MSSCRKFGWIRDLNPMVSSSRLNLTHTNPNPSCNIQPPPCFRSLLSHRCIAKLAAIEASPQLLDVVNNIERHEGHRSWVARSLLSFFGKDSTSSSPFLPLCASARVIHLVLSALPLLLFHFRFVHYVILLKD